MVVFDEPQRDGDGDGPYSSAVIWETYLVPIAEGEVDDAPDAQERRAARDRALRAVLEHPEGGESAHPTAFWARSALRAVHRAPRSSPFFRPFRWESRLLSGVGGSYARAVGPRGAYESAT
jgi:hypothetical protein